jgi:hypothetical protein
LHALSLVAMTISLPVVRRFSATATAQCPFPIMSVLFSNLSPFNTLLRFHPSKKVPVACMKIDEKKDYHPTRKNNPRILINFHAGFRN